MMRTDVAVGVLALLPALIQAQPQATAPAPGAAAASPAVTPTEAPASTASAEATTAAQQPAATAAKAPDKTAPAKATAGADGFSLQSDGGDYRLRFGGYAQGDGRFYADDAARLGSDSFVLRRVRPQLQGTLAQRFDFYLLTDFGGGTATVQDAYLDARFSSWLRLRAGKFKVPFGLERLQSGANLPFVERALPTSIAPNRDVGLQLHGEAAGGVLAYALAAQNGTADGGSSDGDTSDGKDLSLRVFLQPFKRGNGPFQGLGLGLAGQLGRQEASAPAGYRSPGQLAFFSYASGVAVNGTRQRLSPQGWFYAGPFGLLGEYAVSSTPVSREAARARIRNDAWQVAASFFLTREKAAFQAVRPIRPFDPARGGWGAFELAARAHQLSIDPDAFAAGFADASRSARRATAWAIGLNWHLNRNVRYVLDYEQTTFRGGAAAGDRPTERAVLLRAQVLF
jgi:phosphate-selective porin OprO/OprP